MDINTLFERPKSNKKRKTSTLSARRIYGSTGAKSQATQIDALSRRVNSIARAQTGLKHWGQWKKEVNLQGGTNANGAVINLQSERFNIFPLIIPKNINSETRNEMQKIFQATSDMENSNQLTLTSIKVNTYFRLGNSGLAQPPCPVSLMIVAVKKDMGAQFAEDLGLNTTSYAGNPVGGVTDDSKVRDKYFSATAIQAPAVPVTGDNEYAMMLANPGVFRVLYERHFHLGNIVNTTAVPEDDAAVTNIADATKTFRYSGKLKQSLKAGEGKWKDLTVEMILPDEQIYLVVHYGTSEVSSGISMASQVMFTGYTAN